MLRLRDSRILAIGAHTDDIELGCGGTIARAIRSGCFVHYLIFSIARASVPSGYPEDTLAREAREAAVCMGIAPEAVEILDVPVREFPSHRQDVLDSLVRLKRNASFDVVFFPSPYDIHQDHATVAAETLRAFKSTAVLLSYDLPWNSLGQGDEVNAFVSLTEDDVRKKVDVLKCFTSQGALRRPYMEADYIFAWSRFRGLQAGVEHSEAFRVWRLRV